MSPKKLEAALLSDHNISTETSKSSLPKQPVIQQEDNFVRFDKPFGFEQHVVNTIVFVTTHTCALYYCYVFHVAKLVDPKAILFGKS